MGQKQEQEQDPEQEFTLSGRTRMAALQVSRSTPILERVAQLDTETLDYMDMVTFTWHGMVGM